MNRTFWLLFLISSFIKVSAQDTLHYDIIVSGLTVGDFTVCCNHPASNTTHYFLDSKIDIKYLYSIEYQMESEFKNNEMTYSHVTGYINHKKKYSCNTQKQNGGYRVSDLDGKSHFIKGTINNGMTEIYNTKPQRCDSIFSEYAGIFKPFVQVNDSTYVLKDLNSDHDSYYYYKNGIMVKGKMPNSILDFYFILRLVH